MIEIFTDGSAYPNPGPGGFGVVIMENNKILDIISGRDEHTTNNEQELLAIKEAIKYSYAIKPKETIIIYSDSAYAINCSTEWAESWSRNNWTRQGGKPILNLEIIQEIYELTNKQPPFTMPTFVLRKVKGHKGTIGNELADAVASGNKIKFIKFAEQLESKI